MTAGKPPPRVHIPTQHPQPAPDLGIALALGRVASALVLPNLMIAGVSHAGAPTLARELSRHPDVYTAGRVDRFTPLRFGRPVESGIEDYAAHFADWNGQTYRLETAATYFDGGPILTAALQDDVPGLRVLLILRDPVARLWSSYSDKVRRRRLPRAMTYQMFVDRCLALRVNDAERFEGNRQFRTLSAGFYLEHLPAWLETFGSRVRVVFSEELAGARAATMAGVLDWLGLDAQALLEESQSEDGELGDRPAPDSGGSFALRPMLQRTPGLWRTHRVQPALPEVPRQSDRTRSAVASIYAGPNRELAGYLRQHGYGRLPDWLARA